jgi:hypothetical protein
MHYVIQENTFREENYDNLTKALDRLGLSYDVVKVLPFIDEIRMGEEEYVTEHRNVFVFGAVKLARVAVSRSWNPGSLLNENHDYRRYSVHYREHLLNYDSEVIKFNDEVHWKGDQMFFRPCEDTKTFTGRLFEKDEWEEFRERMLSNGYTNSVNELTPIQVSTPKKIYSEYRVWLVNGKCITASQYKLGSMYYTDERVDSAILQFCEERAREFQLASSFVMDIADTVDGYKIVECGCINSAGFYKCDIQRLIIALEDFYDLNLP